MKCCVSTDVRTWTNWLSFEPDPDYSPDAGTGLLSSISYALQRGILLRRENPTYRYWAPVAEATRGFNGFIRRQPWEHLCRRYMRCTECPSSLNLQFACRSYVVIVTASGFNIVAMVCCEAYAFSERSGSRHHLSSGPPLPKNSGSLGCAVFGVLMVYIGSIIVHLGPTIIGGDFNYNDVIGNCIFVYGTIKVSTAELKMGQWVMGRGSNGSTYLDGSHGSWVSIHDPLIYE